MLGVPNLWNCCWGGSDFQYGCWRWRKGGGWFEHSRGRECGRRQGRGCRHDLGFALRQAHHHQLPGNVHIVRRDDGEGGQVAQCQVKAHKDLIERIYLIGWGIHQQFGQEIACRLHICFCQPEITLRKIQSRPRNGLNRARVHHLAFQRNHHAVILRCYFLFESLLHFLQPCNAGRLSLDRFLNRIHACIHFIQFRLRVCKQ